GGRHHRVVAFSVVVEAAIEAASWAIRSNPDYAHPYRWLAAALGQLGRVAEAKEALEKAIAVVPGSFDAYVRRRVPCIGRKTTPTCSKACAKPVGRSDAGARLFCGDRLDISAPGR